MYWTPQHGDSIVTTEYTATSLQAMYVMSSEYFRKAIGRHQGTQLSFLNTTKYEIITSTAWTQVNSTIYLFLCRLQCL